MLTNVTDRQTDGQTDAKRWHDRSIAILAWSGKSRLQYVICELCDPVAVCTTVLAYQNIFRNIALILTIHVQGGPKLDFLNVDNLATVSGEKVRDSLCQKSMLQRA